MRSDPALTLAGAVLTKCDTTSVVFVYTLPSASRVGRVAFGFYNNKVSDLNLSQR